MNIEIQLDRPFQSFTTGISLSDLNDFVVMTGRNGAGKSQLLRLIDGKSYGSPIAQGRTTIQVGGDYVSSDEVVLITTWDMPSAPPASANELMNATQQVLAIVAAYLQGQAPTRNQYPSFSNKQLTELRQVSETLRQGGFDGVTRPVDIDRDVVPLLSSDFDNHSAEIVNERIGKIIYSTYFNAFSEKRDVSDSEDPIKAFNNLCADFDLDFHLAPFTSPLRPYVPILHDGQDDLVDWSQLSAGEMVLFRIITWIFYYEQNNTLYPKLLLLDEPDAHLSPKMIRKFIDSLQSILVEQMGINVIMTTHSPNTVALTDETTLHELTKSGPTHTMQKISKSDALRTFSEGLIFVQERTRLIFLEGKADPHFYSKCYEIAVTKHGLTNHPSLNFIPVSQDDPDEGGCTKVIAMIRKFDGTIVSDLVHGIIDMDRGNAPSINVHVIPRYSIENYIYDPMVIAIALVRAGRHAQLLPSTSALDTNDVEGLLTTDSLLVSAVKEVLGHIRNQLSAQHLDETSFECMVLTKYLDQPIRYELPRWFLDLKKSDLTTSSLWNMSQAMKPISEKEQYLAMESAGLVHKEIYDLLARLAA